VVKKRSFAHEYTVENQSLATDIPLSEMVEDRWVHDARRLTSIEFSFDPCNIYRDGPKGVGYPADARSVGDSHPSCLHCCKQEKFFNSYMTKVSTSPK